MGSVTRNIYSRLPGRDRPPAPLRSLSARPTNQDETEPLSSVEPSNRKYLGSKARLLRFLQDVLEKAAAGVSGQRRVESLGDLFAGTGVVARHFAERGARVVACDLLYSNALTCACFLTPEDTFRQDRLARLVRYLNRLPGREGYCFAHYGGAYFTPENAARIDAVREEIQSLKEEGALSRTEEAILLTSLLYAADKAANTCGQYDAFLKHLGDSPYQEGVHRVDACAYWPLILGLPRLLPRTGLATVSHRVVCGDANTMARRHPVQVLYLDPPYNTRQYCDNYHVLENIARWEKPPVRGVTRKFDRSALKSDYSRADQAVRALEDLVRHARCRILALSYNSEGIVPDQEILRILSLRGRVEVHSREYRIFGNGAGVSRPRPIRERIFVVKVRR